MKYCPYCGADILNGSVSFCAECGEALNGTTKEKKIKKEKRKRKSDRTPVKEKVTSKVPEEVYKTESDPALDPDFGYDGYYDDVLPADDAVERQQLDKATIKNLVIIIVGVILAITICVIAMYLM